jgi:glycerol-3-phosphate dehydrogenase (NAD(P)+)
MTKIVILGAGMMGTALAVPLADRGHEVHLVGTPLDGDIVASLQQSSVHPKLRLEVPRSVRAHHQGELTEVAQRADVYTLGVSSAGTPWAIEHIAPFVRPETPIFMITKGLAWDGKSLITLPDLVQRGLRQEVRDRVHPAAIAGPCIAGELARRVPTCVALAGRDRATLDRIAAVIRAPYYHPFVTTDVVGAEVSAALKNAYAMGIAFAVGLHEKAGGAPGSVAMHNTESATMAQAVFEMRRVVRALGGEPDTVSGLAGVGDLDVTTNGGRTGRFGRLLGLGMSRAEAVAEMGGATLECLEILATMRAALRGGGVGDLGEADLPLLTHMTEVALDGAPVDLPLSRFFSEQG